MATTVSAAFQNGNPVNLNAVDFGAAYLPQNQDPTQGTRARAWRDRVLPTNLLKPYRGLSNINQNTTEFQDTYHSIQTNFNRRFRNGFSFGVNYVLSLSYTGNTGLQQRLQHAPDGTISVRADQAAVREAERAAEPAAALHQGQLGLGSAGLQASNAAGKVVGSILNDWQLSGLFTGGSGNRYDLNYSYNANGGNVNLTGSPDYGARIV